MMVRRPLQDRARFYEIAVREMRRVLLEHAHGGVKNGNGGMDLAAFDGALEHFAQTYPRKSEVVELKFFGGLETQEISELLQVSEKRCCAIGISPSCGFVAH